MAVESLISKYTYDGKTGNSSTMSFHVRIWQQILNGEKSQIKILVYLTGHGVKTTDDYRNHRTYVVCFNGASIASGIIPAWTGSNVDNNSVYVNNVLKEVSHATPSSSTASCTFFARQNLYYWNSCYSTTNHVETGVQTINLTVPRSRIYSKGWKYSIPYVYSGGWKPAVAYMRKGSDWKFAKP